MSLLSKFKTDFLVFRHDDKTPPNLQGGTCGSWMLADSQNIESLFGKDRDMTRRFNHFLSIGAMGVFCSLGGEWVSYGWSSKPGKQAPPHLPKWVGKHGNYWIFHCHTREKFRGKGYYKQLLSHMTRTIRTDDSDTAIYIDTLPDNTPSRRAIHATGFAPYGVITTYKLWIPHVGDWILEGNWAQKEPHPELRRNGAYPAAASAAKL